LKPKWIILRFFLWLASLAMLVLSFNAYARITCTPSSIGFSTAYPASGGALNITAASFTVTCSKTGGGTATATYQTAANNGANPTGSQNRARRGATTSYLNYNLTSDLSCGSAWKGTALIQTPAYTTPPLSNGQSDVHTFNFWGCVPAGLTVPTNGTYTDTVTMTTSGTVSTGTSRFNTATCPVSIIAPATCTFSTQPGPITLNYSSFGASVLAYTSFRTNCTNLLPYTVALDTASGTIVGLNFTLALNTTANSGGANPLASRGTGAAQTFFINADIAAGQSGNCAAGSCSGFQTHFLTITY
jgi:spore coat protein U-like protein